uniref:RNA 3'-terminal phosphate cyclase n=1 Tax=Eptatretus burgeri TaxID=7764 RepID=A0A8C4QCW3_EPTBU
MAGQTPINIDGAILEGGGQSLRVSTSLSCIVGKSIRVFNIRAGRTTPGLRSVPQHLSGLIAVRDLCGGSLLGGDVGSLEITFQPGPVRGGQLIADTHTAGSVCLLLQVTLPCALFSASPSCLTLRGGTNADMAPQLDYMLQVFKPIAEKFGVKFDCIVKRRGYYPKGGGEVVVKVSPIGAIKPIILTERGDVTKVFGRAFVIMLCICIYIYIYLLLPIINDDFGCAGVPADKVGVQASEMLIHNLHHGGCVDDYLQDQLIIFMALAQGVSRVLTGPITLHTQTAIHFAEQLTQDHRTLPKGEEEDSYDSSKGGGHSVRD